MDGEETVKELLEEYPDGFAVSPTGGISKTLLATSHLSAVVGLFPSAGRDQGFLVVEMVERSVGGNYSI